MKRTFLALGLFFAAVPLFAQVPTNTPTDTATDTPTDTPTLTATATPTFTATLTATNTATATITLTPTNTATPTITLTPTTTFTITLTFTPTNTPTVTSTPTITFTPGHDLFNVSENIVRPAVGPVSIHVGSFSYGGPYTLAVYNSAGEVIKILDNNQNLPAAIDIQYTWDGTNTHGDKVASGVYLIFLKRPLNEEMKKVLLVR